MKLYCNLLHIILCRNILHILNIIKNLIIFFMLYFTFSYIILEKIGEEFQLIKTPCTHKSLNFEKRNKKLLEI